MAKKFLIFKIIMSNIIFNDIYNDISICETCEIFYLGTIQFEK